MRGDAVHSNHDRRSAPDEAAPKTSPPLRGCIR